MNTKQVGARPNGRCDMRPSGIITDYHRKSTFMSTVTADSFRICTWYSHSFSQYKPAV